MTALQHLISHPCPECNVSLFRCATPMGADTVFCSECGRAGLYEEIIKKGKRLTLGVLTKPEIEGLLRQLGITRE